MQGLGVEVYVIAPQNWDEQGKRQVNDQHDALVMCRRLSEYLAGHHKALSIVRIPSPEEEARRAQGRMREQLCRQIRRMQAMGRSLLLQRGLAVRGRWWRGRSWEHILGAMPSWVIAQLEIWKELLELAEKQVRQIEMQLKKAAPGKLLFGEGELTHELLARELIDPQRFRNARQVGNYFGLCPSESTSERAPADGFDYEAWQSTSAPLDGRARLAGESLPALLPGSAPMGSAPRRSQNLRGRAQESDRRAGPTSGR